VKAFAACCFAAALFARAAHAALGMSSIAVGEGEAPVTVFYPSSDAEQAVARGPFTLQVAPDGKPVRGNGRLIVVSHGSGGAAVVHADLARALVERGFVVAMPEHKGDNFRDTSQAGPESFKRRPVEVSHTIDAIARDRRFAGLLALDKVGMFGMSAGGHAALTLAGGRWSPSRMKEHCEAHIAEDFHSCVGVATRLTGGFFDGVKISIALWILRNKLDDPAWYSYTDPRIAVIVADVPYAVDFDLSSLAQPRVPLALVTSQKDIWLLPRFHSEPLLRACTTCVRLVDLPTGGHGALLSPFPPKLPDLAEELLKDPPGFDRAVVPEVNRKIAAFFAERLAH
jgi:predicted dienelactone hydrolase